jgi:tetratricopeptide (TPR) repeat protein
MTNRLIRVPYSKVHIVLLLLLLSHNLFGQSELKPTVSAREAQLLQQASAISATNIQAAVSVLIDQRTADSSAAIDFAIGNFNFQQALYKAAVTNYQEAVRKWPSFRDARKNLGRVYLLLEQEDNALAVYRNLVEDGLADAESYLLLGHVMLIEDRAVSAETAFRQVLLLAPDQQDARRGLIQALLAQERWPEVKQLVRSALSDAPEDAALWSLLANVSVALDDTVSAIRAIETARRLTTCSPQLLMLLGDLYLDAGRAAEAVACYAGAQQSDTIEPSRLLRAVEGLIQMGEADRAEALLRTIEPKLSPPPEDVELDVLRLHADILCLRGERQQAIERYRMLVARDPLDGDTLLRLGDLLRDEGEASEAELTYERAGRIAGFKAPSLVRRARLDVDARRYSEAISLLEAAQRLVSQPHVERYLEQVRRLEEMD